MVGYVPNLFLEKRNKRMMIVDGEGKVVYTPPDFIQMNGREDLRRVIDSVQGGTRLIDAIIDFEIRFNRKAMHKAAAMVRKRYPVTLRYLAEH